MIAIDNTLWDYKVLKTETMDADTEALKRLNVKISKDPRVQATISNIGDGYTMVVKL